MSLRYSLIVTSPLYGRQGSATALNFAKALIAEGHRLQAVFFYLDGVSNALATSFPTSDEINIHQQWLVLKQQANCDLLVCSAAAYRRGILDHEQAQQLGLSANMSSQFTVSGLAEMATVMLSADRVVHL